MKQFASCEISDVPVNNFYQAIYIYLKKTQVVNRKLSCSSNVVYLELKATACENVNKEIIKTISGNVDSARDALMTNGIEFSEGSLNDLNEYDESQNGTFMSIDRLLPRNLQKFKSCHIATFIDTKNHSATFYPIDSSDNLAPPIVYKFTYSKDLKKLFLSANEDSPDTKWLQFVLLKKIRNWIENCEIQSTIESHHLIDSEVFNETYARLKEKYGKKLEEGWSESTDPKKFIYEDIAIASYLIVLWRHERNENETEELQSFVDLGCGNGLLVYILTQENHRGYGIDLRKRKIWSQFPPTTDLREIAVVPSDESLFSDVDWIIGNHSDELSPWIPVISARSSFTSRYFLLPCCAFEFSGAKFQRRDGTKSQYLSFVDYLTTISETCGFSDTKIDRLKIPSTKRICLVGTKRSYEESNFKLKCQQIQAFIDSSNTQHQGSSDKWSESFTPRTKTEPVKNCSKIDKSLSESIVKTIFEKLLAFETKCDEFPEWNCGGQLTIREAVELVSTDDLKQLKRECGGLQTLLRNKHQIFKIHGGAIRIRLPTRISERSFTEKSRRRQVVKSSDCYFHKNYSCPLEESECCYKH